MSPEPPGYAVQRLREALIADERVAEMGVAVRVVDGTVILSGQVPTEERRRAVGAVAGEVLAGYEIHNETVVTEVADPPGVEHLR